MKKTTADPKLELLIRALPGVNLDGVDAETVVEELQKLEATSDGATPWTILAAARKKSNPLHRCFTWDDTEAAEKWRLEQARRIAGCVRVLVRIEGAPKETKPISVRVFQSLPGEEPGEGRKYHNILALPQTDKERVLEEAKRDLEKWRAKYAHLIAFLKVRFVVEDEG